MSQNSVKIELAPMEGITTYIYRNAISKFYGGVDTFFSPFISTHEHKELNFKEKKEILPDNNIGYTLIPQVLTADADEFLYTAGQISQYGYDHINLNFGCPSGTVTAKGKGSGALVNTDKLERLLDEIFSRTSLKISVKTRMGYSDYSEWERIFSIYEKFPLEELIVHARVREDFYNGCANVDALAKSFDDFNSRTGNTNVKVKLSYNGDIYTASDYLKICERMPYLSACMIGRGAISNPALPAQIKNSKADGNMCDDMKRFKDFNYYLIEKYSEIMPGEKNTLFKLKELWVYMIKSFEESELESKKLLKSIRKCNSLKEYERIVSFLN